MGNSIRVPIISRIGFLVKINNVEGSNTRKLVKFARGKGNAGDIIIDADGKISADGGAEQPKEFQQSGIFSGFEDPGTGKPGNINIQANSLSLSNQASIKADTQSETGDSANIILKLTEDLRLSNNSLISARAEGGADGGNIIISSQTSIIADDSQTGEEGNDIIASAEEGNGGIIILYAVLDGIQEGPAIDENGNRLENGTNDIDASSRFGSQGTIKIRTSEIFIELPETLRDVSDKIAENICEQGVGSEFIVTGKGGLTPNPSEPLNSDEEQVGLVEPVPLRQEDEETERQGDGEIGRRGDGETGRPETPTPEAVPAQGWIFMDNGQVMLTSYKTHDTEIKPPPQQKFNGCSTSTFENH